MFNSMENSKSKATSLEHPLQFNNSFHIFHILCNLNYYACVLQVYYLHIGYFFDKTVIHCSTTDTAIVLAKTMYTQEQ